LVGGIKLLQPLVTRFRGNQERKIHMSKNMTRKGLAIVSATSLALMGFVSPIFAAQADTTKVSLGPTTGDAYAVVATTLTGTFHLDANHASSVVGGDLIFQIGRRTWSNPPRSIFLPNCWEDWTNWDLTNLGCWRVPLCTSPDGDVTGDPNPQASCEK
jgi:hypothetical protein